MAVQQIGSEPPIRDGGITRPGVPPELQPSSETEGGAVGPGGQAGPAAGTAGATAPARRPRGGTKRKALQAQPATLKERSLEQGSRKLGKPESMLRHRLKKGQLHFYTYFIVV